MPIVAGFGDQSVGVEPCHGAPGQRHRRALLIQGPRPVLNTGPVALDDRSAEAHVVDPLFVREGLGDVVANGLVSAMGRAERDRKSTRLNSSHANISYAVFCLKKK